MNDFVVNYVARLNYLYCDEAIFDLWICDALDVSAFNLIERNNLIVLSVVVFCQIINVLTASLCSLFSLLEVTKQKELFFLIVGLKRILALDLIL
jgi:hypothetical protein